jgi:glycosyltransferase involved in cell wall biosynthesis
MFIYLPETVDEEEIASTYQLMDIMLHTSRIGESFGMTLVEGMLFGLPILTNSTDFRECTLFDRDNSQ